MSSYSLGARSFAARHTCSRQRAVATAARTPVRSRQHTVAVRASKVSVAELRSVAEKAAQAGAEVVMAALDQPRNIKSKGAIGDIVTDTDKASEVACIAAIQAAFPDHGILGEEGGLIGSGDSDYLWCIDPLDGTCNFAHNYPGFCVSIGVLRHALPVAGCVIEFTGGPGKWSTRTYSGGRNLGSTVDGKTLMVSNVRKLEDALIATEFNYHMAELWPSMVELFKDFSQHSMGIRASGAAAVNLCHLAAGQIDAYYQYMLKPWDTAAGIAILEEAGGRVTTADGAAYSVFDRSLLCTNDALYEQVLAKIEGPTSRAIERGVHLGPANVPKTYKVKSGAQLE